MTTVVPPSAADFAALTAEVKELKLTVHELVGVVRRKVADPVESLTVAEACKRLKKGERTLRRLLARRLFTDARCGRRREWRLLADEVDEYRLRGESGVEAFRVRMGRA